MSNLFSRLACFLLGHRKTFALWIILPVVWCFMLVIAPIVTLAALIVAAIDRLSPTQYTP